MYVVRHDFQGMQGHMQFISFGRQQHFQPCCHRTDQDRLAILRAEDEVIFEREDGASVACIPVMFHITSIAQCSMNNNYLTQKGLGKTAVLLTQDMHSSAC